jgi:hypothetical protein
MISNSDISTLLNSIGQFSQDSSLDEFELSNLTQDLQHVLLRLQTKMYQESDYENRNIFDVPRRTEEFLRYLAGYDFQGEMWSLLLKPLVTQETQNILDLCPGWAPKIELALWKSGYKNNVYLLDTELNSIESIIRYMHMLKADLKIITTVGNFFTSPSIPKMDIVVANHIIDDLLLNEYCATHNQTLAQLYASEEKLLAAVSDICQHDKSHQSDYQKEFALKISTQLVSFLKPSSHLVLTQYAGLFEKAHQLDKWVDFVSSIFDLVATNLEQEGLIDIKKDVVSNLSPEQQTFFESKQLLVFTQRV